jgi:hypothetical protein
LAAPARWPARPDPGMDASRIAAIFERFTTGYHFYLEDLRSGERVELGDPGPWPIGSCFKLAVLVAYFEALIDGTLPADSLDTETLIPPDQFSTGAGVLSLLDSPIRLTDRHLLHWMLAASDGTATDVLIAKLGLSRVQATLTRLAPDSTLECNLNDMVARFRMIPGALDCKTRVWSPEDAAQFRRATCDLGRTNAANLAGLALKTFQFSPPPLEDPPPVAARLAPDGDVHGSAGQDRHQDGLSGVPLLRPGLRRDRPGDLGSTAGDLRLLRRGVPVADEHGRHGDGVGGPGDPQGAWARRDAWSGLDAGGCEPSGWSRTADLRADYMRCLATRRAVPRSEAFLPGALRSLNKGGSLGMRYFASEGGTVSDAASGRPIYAFGYCSEGWRLPAFVVETVCGLIGLEIARAVGLDPDPNWDWTHEGAELLLGDLWRP